MNFQESSVGRSVENSTVVAALRTGLDQVQASIGTSRIARAMSSVSCSFSDAVATSRMDRYLSSFLTWVQHAFLVRWFTRANDDRTIVIDPTDAFAIRTIVVLSERSRSTGMSLSRKFDIQSSAGIVSFVSKTPIRAISIVVAGAVVANGIVLVIRGGSSIVGLSIRGIVLGVAVVGIQVNSSWETLSQARAIQLLETIGGILNPADGE